MENMKLKCCWLLISILLSGCTGVVPYGVPTKSEVEQTRAQNKLKNEAVFEEVRISAVPDDYKEKIDAFLDNYLKDPQSKLVEYVIQPKGSLVCGSINAKNSYGGYTGKEPFYAYFGRDGSLKGFEKYDLKDIGYVCEDMGCEMYSYRVFAQSCIVAASKL